MKIVNNGGIIIVQTRDNGDTMKIGVQLIEYSLSIILLEMGAKTC